MASNGVFMPGLKVKDSGSGMGITILPGVSVTNGYFYTLDAPLSLAVAASDTVAGRRDSVMIRYDKNAAEIITAQIITGAFSSSPTAPDVVRDGTVFDLKIAEIVIQPGAGAIQDTDIIDTRLNKSVCGQSTFGGQDVAAGSIDQSSGNWVPEISYSGNVSGFSYGPQQANYTRIGNRVDVVANIPFFITPGSPGSTAFSITGLRIDSLPFAPRTEFTVNGNPHMQINGNFDYSYSVTGSDTYGGASFGGIRRTNNPAVNSRISFSPTLREDNIIMVNNMTASRIGFSFSYFTDD